jgi:hypothetical protein
MFFALSLNPSEIDISHLPKHDNVTAQADSEDLTRSLSEQERYWTVLFLDKIKKNMVFDQTV